MPGIRKYGGHRYHLNVPLAAAGSAADLVGDSFIYDAFPNGAATAAATNTIDPAVEQLTEASVVTYAVLTGQATNFVSLRFIHRNAAGTTKNDIRVVFSAAGVVTAAFVPVNFAQGSGATVTGAGTGTLTVTTGTALPWDLVPGDTITLDRVSNNATGLATPQFSGNIFIQLKGT